MSPGALLAVMILIWLGLLAGLWWVALRIEQMDARVREWAGGRRG